MMTNKEILVVLSNKVGISSVDGKNSGNGLISVIKELEKEFEELEKELEDINSTLNKHSNYMENDKVRIENIELSINSVNKNIEALKAELKGNINIRTISSVVKIVVTLGAFISALVIILKYTSIFFKQ